MMNLEYYADEYLKEQSEENERKMMSEIVKTIIEDSEIIIDGEKMDDGSVDPCHIQVETDDRFYFHVYTSKKRFDSCNGKNAYVLTLKDLLQPIFQEDTFGGITLNYKKGEEVVLITKENIYHSMNLYLKDRK